MISPSTLTATGLSLLPTSRQPADDLGRTDLALLAPSPDPQPALETPYLVVDVRVVADRFRRFAAAFGDADVHYAVKANPQPAVLRTLVAQGSSFDVASRAEVDLCLAAGADPATLSYGNTIKKADDIGYAHRRGVRTFSFDSEAELLKLADRAPGASVVCRLLVSSEGAQWPLGRKFGCSPQMAADLLRRAAVLGLRPAGLSFHVGSQQLDPSRWESAIAQAAEVAAAVRAHGIALSVLNAGGGFPVAYRTPVAPIEAYAGAIRSAMDRHFGTGPDRPALMLEPGRHLVAEAGLLRSQVVLVSRKSYQDDRRWVYLDVGRFGGLAETEGEAIQYRLRTPRDGEAAGPVALAGPTCDSVDILYQHAPYTLPLSLRDGDVVEIEAAGAYTTTYSSVGFNGFGPLATVCIGEDAG